MAWVAEAFRKAPDEVAYLDEAFMLDDKDLE